MNVEPQVGANAIVRAHHLDLDLAVDDLDHPAWAKAQPVQIRRRWSGEDAPASRHAEARIIWTEKALLVRFICRQEEPLTVSSNPRFDQKTLKLWEKDVCEIFVAPDSTATGRYFEFEAAPTGEWVDLAVRFTPAGRETDFDFHSGMTTAARIDEGKLTIAIRIPWSDPIPKPAPGDEWRANLFRCVGLGNERYLAWQPTFTAKPNFHVPDAFGRLRFI
jgi:hypothetical protein